MVLFFIFCKTSDILFGPPSTHKPININEQIKMKFTTILWCIIPQNRLCQSLSYCLGLDTSQRVHRTTGICPIVITVCPEDKVRVLSPISTSKVTSQ